MHLEKNGQIKINLSEDLTQAQIKDLKMKTKEKYGLSSVSVERPKRKLFKDNTALEAISSLLLTENSLKEATLTYLENNKLNMYKDVFFKLDAKVMNSLEWDFNKSLVSKDFNFGKIKAQNILSFENFNRDYLDNVGTNSITSFPTNKGGKSSYIKMPMILLYGGYTKGDDKSSKISDIINSETKGDGLIEGEIIKSDGTVYYIVRKLKRTKTGASQKLSLFRFDESFSELDELGGRKGENLTIKNSVATQHLINEIFGNYDDYKFSSYTDSTNIFKWLTNVGVNRDRIFAEYFGLGIFEEKRLIANELKKEFNKSKINGNTETLKLELSKLKEDFLIEVSTAKSLESKTVLKTELLDEYNDSLITCKSKLKNSSSREIEHINVDEVKKSINKGENYVSDVLLKISSLEAEDLFDNSKSFMELSKGIHDLKQELNDFVFSDKLSLEQTVEELANYKSKAFLNDLIDKDETIKTLLTDKESINCDLLKLETEINFFENKKDLDYDTSLLTCEKCGHIKDVEEINADYLHKTLGLKSKKEQKQNDLNKLNFIHKHRLLELSNIVQTKITDTKQSLEVIESKQTYEKSEFERQINLKIKKLEKTFELKTSFDKLIKVKASANEKLEMLKTKLNVYLENQKNISDDLENESKIIELTKKVSTTSLDLNDTVVKLNTCKAQQLFISKQITRLESTIKSLEKQYIEEILFKHYIDAHDTKGISRDILLKTLPKLNQQLSEEMIDFDFEVDIVFNGKNIEFLLKRGDTKRTLSAGSGFEKTTGCLMIHFISLLMSNIPKANNIVFDEIMAGIGEDELELILPIFDKFKRMFDTVDIVTHTYKEKMDTMCDNSSFIKKISNISHIM